MNGAPPPVTVAVNGVLLPAQIAAEFTATDNGAPTVTVVEAVAEQPVDGFVAVTVNVVVAPKAVVKLF